MLKGTMSDLWLTSTILKHCMTALQGRPRRTARATAYCVPGYPVRRSPTNNTSCSNPLGGRTNC
eukprot:scaffold14812_cov18-Prasinocladus_malaysianus.AAC.2